MIAMCDIRAYKDFNDPETSGKGYRIVNSHRIDSTSTGTWSHGEFDFCIGYELGVLKKR